MNTSLIFFLLSALAGFACAVAGTYWLWGTGAALMCAALCFFISAGFIRSGMAVYGHKSGGIVGG